MKTSKIDFTENEAQATINLINVAVKSVGLDDGGGNAQNGIYLINKFKAAFPAEEPIKETPKQVRDKVVKKK